MSDYITWTPAMSVESTVLDDHHRIIVDCLNTLHPMIGQPDRATDLPAVVDRLEHFVLVHFSEEESLMIKAGYPDWRAHKELHDRMYEVVYSLKSDIQRGKMVDAAQLFDLVNGWLVQHILGEDRKYVPYLKDPHEPKSHEWTSDHRN